MIGAAVPPSKGGAGPPVLGVPGQELRDQRVPLDALWPAGLARRAADQITAAADRAAAIQAVVGRRLAGRCGSCPGCRCGP